MLFSTALVFIGMQPIAGQISNSSATPMPPRSSFKNYLAPEKSFEFTFECKHSNKTACSMAQAEIEHVGKLIGNELLFTRPAKVKVEFLDEVSPRKRMYTRRPIPAQRVQDSVLGQMLSYPTILAKQAIDSTTETPLAIDDSGTSPRFDFELVFDKNTPFTALSDREGYDLQFIAAEHFTEQLGFADGVVSHYVGPKGPKVALPTYLEYNNSGFIEYLTPLDDITYTVPTSQRCINFLVGNRKCPEYQYSIAEHSATFKEYQMKLLDSRQLTDDRNFLKKGVELLKLENENRFEVRFKDGSVYPLKIDRFSPRRGVFFNSPTDFFITKTTFDNIPLAERMKFHGTESIFGPLTLKFFEEIGYSTRSKQQKLVLKPSESGMQLLKQLGPLIDKFDDSYFI